jgi:flagellar protein FlgJ
MGKIEDYVVNHIESAKAAGQKYNMDPLVILSQAAQESGWGTSLLSKTFHNYFGIIAAGSKNEYWKGQIYDTQNKYKLKFRVYDTPQDSFCDFARLISSKYKAAHAVSNDYKAYAEKIANSPYISESNGDNRELYKNNIIKIYEKIAKVVKAKSLA